MKEAGYQNLVTPFRWILVGHSYFEITVKASRLRSNTPFYNNNGIQTLQLQLANTPTHYQKAIDIFVRTQLVFRFCRVVVYLHSLLLSFLLQEPVLTVY